MRVSAELKHYSRFRSTRMALRSSLMGLYSRAELGVRRMNLYFSQHFHCPQQQSFATHFSLAPDGYRSSTDGNGSLLSKPGCGKSGFVSTMAVCHTPLYSHA